MSDQFSLDFENDPDGKTRSTQEAMDVLLTHKADLIGRARLIAIGLARQYGEVTSRDVRSAMRHLLTSSSAEYWLGAVFRDPVFEWTGRYATYSDPSRNIHERTIKVWRLR